MSNARGVWQVPELRDDGDEHRPVGWVELFFDLVFVVIIAVLAGNLEAGGGLIAFLLQFMAVFWVWNAFTYYTERFESRGLENRLFTFIGILTVAGLAVWGRDGLGANYLGFAISYLLARSLNIALWLRAAAHVARFRRAALGFTGGFVVALLLLLISFFVSGAPREILWAVAVLIEITTPAVTGRFQAGLPLVSRDKFPERFGLLTMIVLGETVSGIIRSVAAVNQARALTPLTIVEAVLGLVIGFGMWWVYFDFVARRPSRQGIGQILIWIYLHLAMLAGIVIVGVALFEAVALRPVPTLPRSIQSLLFVGLGFTLVIIALIETTLDRAADEPTHSIISPVMKAATGVALAVLAAIGVPLPTTVAFGISVVALGIQAAYGARVYYRRQRTVSAKSL
ncbi:MAG TPA: low temperature requirement protein A [Galbitalea sp.]